MFRRIGVRDGTTGQHLDPRRGAGSRLFRRGVMDAGRVARAGHDGLRRGKTLVIPGLRNWLTAESGRFAPRKMVTAVSRWVAEKTE